MSAFTAEMEKYLKEAIESTAQHTAEATARAIERERKRFRTERKDRRYHNTELLLRNYRTLNEHYKYAVFDAEKARESSDEFTEIMELMGSSFGDEDLRIESIRQSAGRTKVIMAHVNLMLEIYRNACERSRSTAIQRRWRELDARYIADDEMSVGEIAIREDVTEQTVRNDLKACIGELTVLFFGVDGLCQE